MNHLTWANSSNTRLPCTQFLVLTAKSSSYQKLKKSGVWSHCSLQLPQYWKVGEPERAAEWTSPIREGAKTRQCIIRWVLQISQGSLSNLTPRVIRALIRKSWVSARAEISLEANCRMKVRNRPTVFQGWGTFYNRSLTAWV